MGFSFSHLDSHSPILRGPYFYECKISGIIILATRGLHLSIDWSMNKTNVYYFLQDFFFVIIVGYCIYIIEVQMCL